MPQDQVPSAAALLVMRLGFVTGPANALRMVNRAARRGKDPFLEEVRTRAARLHLSAVSMRRPFAELAREAGLIPPPLRSFLLVKELLVLRHEVPEPRSGSFPANQKILRNM